MPIIEMHLMEGRTTEQKMKLAKAVTDAVAESLNVNASTVRILMTELKTDEFYVAGDPPAYRAQEQLKNTTQE